MPGGGFGSKKLISVCVLSVKNEKAFKRCGSERGSDTKTICFISKSERRRARGRTAGRTATALKSSGLSLATLRMRIKSLLKIQVIDHLWGVSSIYLYGESLLALLTTRAKL